MIEGQTSSSLGTAQRHRLCKVPGCVRPNCNLSSHRFYRPRSHKSKSHHDGDREARICTSATREVPAGFDNSTLQRPKGADAFVALPVKHSDEVPLQTLFQHFFTSVFDRIAMLFRGPTMPDVVEHKRRMLSVALRDPVYCLGLIMQAHNDMAGARQTFDETRESLVLYSRTVKVFSGQIAGLLEQPRHLLDSFHIELALLNVCILLAYDSHYSRTEILRTHWRGLHSLVQLRGGIRHVTIALPYVLHVDRMCAVFLSQMPAFTNPHTSIIPLPRPSWGLYGARLLRLLEQSFAPFRKDILEHCLTSARLLELLEKRQELPSDQPPGDAAYLGSFTSSEYLYFVRDRLDEAFTLYHAQQAQNRPRENCLLWATRIVEYRISWSNYYSINVISHCEQICAVLKQQDVVDEWRGNLDMLRWILFAVLVAPMKHFNGRGWALKTLQKLIELHKYENFWDNQCQELERSNLLRFVWHDSLYVGPFDTVWQELLTYGSDSSASLK